MPGRSQPYAPGWPGIPDTVEQARANPDSIADHGIDDVTGHYAKILATLPSAPIAVKGTRMTGAISRPGTSMFAFVRSLGSGSLGAPATEEFCQLVSTSPARTLPRASRTDARYPVKPPSGCGM